MIPFQNPENSTGGRPLGTSAGSSRCCPRGYFHIRFVRFDAVCESHGTLPCPRKCRWWSLIGFWGVLVGWRGGGNSNDFNVFSKLLLGGCGWLVEQAGFAIWVT